MRFTDRSRSLEVCNGARHSQHAVKRTRGQVRLFSCRREHRPASGLQPAVRLEPPARRTSVAGIVAREPGALNTPSAFDEGAHAGGIRTCVSRRQAAECHWRDVHVEVDAVSEGTRKSPAILRDFRRRAHARMRDVAEMAAWTGV